ncbi:DUF4435 domain-containing protein [Pseudomonas thivervalensis]|uniref:DUF4435 domain-containing protein n=1 Tax=Pseudomonas thivervalensis TaxID=86265 RepID=UPI003D96B85C
MDADLTRRSSGKFAASVFYEGYNDFDIYIEDTAEGYPKIFSFVLSRLLPATVTLEKIFPLGDRGQVVEAARRETRQNNPRSSVYIVDGDLYLLAGETVQLPPNVIVLPRYCIENFLIDEQAFLQVMNEESAGLNIEKIQKTFDFEGWVGRSKPILRELFEMFAISHKLQSGIPTISRGYKSICKDETGEVDAGKAASIMSEIESALIQEHGVEAVESARIYIRQNINCDSCFLKTYVSGKDFLFPLLFVRMRFITSSRTANLFIKIRMSRWCALEPLSDFGRQVMQVLGLRVNT